MKRILIALAVSLILLFSFTLRAQSPSITLTGGSASFSKGNLNTELLTQLIEKKQQELKQHVFRNMVIRNFNDYSYLENLKNFSTYEYIYNVMDIMTSGKNKSVITKTIMESTADFAYLHGMVLYVQQAYKIEGKPALKAGKFTVRADITDKAMATDTGTDVTIPPEVKDYNYLIDLCYKILKEDNTLHPQFEFSSYQQTNQTALWYNSDNVYELEQVFKEGTAAQFFEKETQEQFLKRIADHKIIHDDVKKKIKDLKNLIDQVTIVINDSQAVIAAKGDNKQAAKDLVENLWDSNQVDLRSLATKINLTSDQQQLVDDLRGKYLKLVPVIQFLSQIKKTELKGLELNKDQFYAIKGITLDFLKIAKNQFQNNVVSGVLTFLIENTLVEYIESGSQNQVALQNVEANTKGYVYVDIESAISTIYEHFRPTARIGKYVQFFFSVGTNQASFLNNNSLAVNDAALPVRLDNFYYASEKIGFRYKIRNWRYTRSFAPGERYDYYRGASRWRRPQPKPFISDVHLMAYASGILYNLANLKTNDNFNYAVAGGGLGVTFFNGLNFNLSIACPFTERSFKKDNVFLNIGFDIPIIEYISALAKK